MIHSFGDFELDDDRLELRKGGDRLEVQPKVLSLLMYLVQHRDRVVPKSELLDELWADVTVLEDALTVAVHEARAALGDSGREQWAIRTAPRRGYRFVATVVDADNPSKRPAAGRDPFVGRDDALERLLASLQKASTGAGHACLITGEPGIGKTRLADELETHARARGARFIAGLGCAVEGAPPYWPWIQILRALLADRDAMTLREEMGHGAADLATILPEIRSTLPDLPAVPALEPDQARFRLFDGLAGFLKRVAQSAPTVLLLDDLQWADHTSQRLLAFLAQQLKTTRLMLVATVREGAEAKDPILAETLAELARSAPGDRIALAGLDLEATRTLIEATAKQAPSAELVEWVARKTEGNPFFIKEVVGLLAAEGELDRVPDETSHRIPPGVRDVIGQRLAALPEACLSFLETASAIGQEFRLEVVERVSGLDAAAFSAALRDATSAGIVAEAALGSEIHAFSHALLRETLYSGLGAPRRGRLHAQIADALGQIHRGNLDPHLSELAEQSFAAGPYGDRQLALDYAARAGERAMAVRAYEQAVVQYEHALQTLELVDGDERRRCELLVARGWAEASAGDRFGHGRETFLLARDLARSLEMTDALAQCALGLGGVSAPTGGGDASLIEVLEDAVLALGGEDGALTARLLARLAMELCTPSTFERGLELSERAVAIGRRSRDRATLGEALFARSMYFTGPAHFEEHLPMADEVSRLAEETRAPNLANWAYQWRLQCFLERGEIEALDAEAEVYSRFAERTRLPACRWYLTTVQIMRAMLDGRLADAEGSILGLLPGVQQGGDRVQFAIILNQLAWLRRKQGRAKEMEPFVGMHSEDDVSLNARFAFHAGMSLLYADLDREDDARREFEHCASDSFSELPRDAVLPACLAYLAESCAYLGDEVRAAELYEIFLPYARLIVATPPGALCLGSASRYLGILATTLSRVEDARRHFEAALEANRRIGSPPWVVYTQLDFARMLHEKGGNDGQAQRLLGDCIAGAKAIGMKEVEERARFLASEIGGAIPLRRRVRPS